MKTFCYPGYAINFLQKGITLSLLILLNLAAYSNPIDKNTELKASHNFLSGNSLFPSFDHSLKNNPPEASNAVRLAECSYHLPKNSGSVPATASGGNEFRFIVRGDNCSWTPVSNAPWITNVAKPNMANIDDSWDVTFSCAANPTASERSGTITLVTGYVYTVTQAASTTACTYTLTSAEARVGAAASTAQTGGNFSVTEQGTDCSWTPATTDNWITNVAKATTANANGSWNVTYSYTENTSAAERRGTITVGDKTHTVIQAGTTTTPTTCSYTLAPTEVNIGSAASTEATKGSFSVTVEGTDCTWTPEPGNVWINNVTKVTPANADGTWTVTYTYMANTNTAERRGTITVGDKTYTVIQAGGATCSITLSKSTGSVPAETGSDAFLVLSNGDACEWTATVAQDATWLTIDEGQIMIGITDLFYTYETNPNPTPRTGTITVSGNTYTVTQEGRTTTPTTCSYTLSPMEANIGSAASTEATKGSFSVTTQGTDCSAIPATTDNWITGLATVPVDAANGLWTVRYSYLANTSATERRGTITVGDKTHTVIQAGAGTATCTITLPSSTTSVPATAGAGSLVVTASSPTCNWTPVVTSTDAAWLFINGGESSRTGTQTLTYSYSTNPTPNDRTATITVAGQTYRVTQERGFARCAYAISPTEARIGAAASTAGTRGSFTVSQAYEGCSSWTAFTGDDWITVTKAARANANGIWTSTYSFTANPSSSERRGRIFADDKILTVIQAGNTESCSYTLSSNTGSVPSGAGSGSVGVTSNRSDCTWTAAVAEDAGWISITAGQTLTGSKAVEYTFTGNTAATPRTGTITVAGHTYTLTQAGTVTTSCSYTLSPTEANIGSAASTEATRGSFSVTTQGTECSARPATTDNWITGLATVPVDAANGLWTVRYSYLANTSVAARRGTITVGDKTHTVIQAGTTTTPTTCSYTLSPTEVNIGAAASTEATKGSFSVTTQGTDCTAIPATTDNWITGLATVPVDAANGLWTVRYSYSANTSATERRGTITVGDKIHTVKQAGTTTTPATCSYTLSPTEHRIGFAASTGQTAGIFTVTIQGTDCSWSPSTTTDWIIDVFKAAESNADGTWDVAYFYAENTTASERRGTITVGDKTHTVIQVGAGTAICTYRMVPMEANIGSAASTAATKGSFSVTAHGTDCSATPTTTDNWITGLATVLDDEENGLWSVTYSYLANTSAAERRGTIRVGDKTHTVIQAGTTTTPGTCSYTLDPMEVRVGSAASTDETKGSFAVTTQGTDCTALPATTDNWISRLATVPRDAEKGLWTITYSYSANTSATERRGTITLGDKIHTVIQAGTTTMPTCSYTLAPLEANIGAAASTEATKGSFSVTTQGTDCTWTPSTTDNWITNVTKAATANGSWNVTYSFTANTTNTERRGTITVGDKTHTVIQAWECSVSLPANAAYVPSTAGEGIIPVVANAQECEWTPTVAQNAAWLSISSEGQNFIGTRNLIYSYQANPSTTLRTGTITVAGQTYTVTQAGAGAACSYTLAPAEANIGSAASTAETKGSFSVTVQGTDCLWTPATTNNWITNVTKAATANADGSWTVTYSYTANTNPAERTGTITVLGQTHTVIQAGTAHPCSYTLAPVEARISSAASTAETEGSFSVKIQGTDCSAMPDTPDNWITLATVAHDAQNGLWTVTYSYTANTSNAERKGTIKVGDKTHTVIQAGTGTACSYTLDPLEARIGSAASTAETKGSFSVTVQGTDCSWTPATTSDWITNVTKAEKANANGTWTVTYSYTANTNTDERKGTITVPGQTHTVTQAGMVTGIESISSMELFPNPAKDFVTLDLSTDKTKYVWLKIVNQAGQILYTMESPPAQALQIPLNGFASGLYFILLQGEGKALVKKLIVR